MYLICGYMQRARFRVLVYNVMPFHKKCLLLKMAYNNKLTMVNLGGEIIALFSLCFSELSQFSALSMYLFYNYKHYLKNSLLFKKFPFHCHSLSLSLTYILLSLFFTTALGFLP